MIEIRTVDRLGEVVRETDGHEMLLTCLAPPQLALAAARVRVAACDFDGTLHAGGSWAVLGKRLPNELRERDAAIRRWYWEQHSDRVVTTLADPDWFHGHLDEGNRSVVDGAWVANDVHWYREAGLTRRDLQEVGYALGAREGARELLEIMDHRAIISFGLEPIIEAWLTHHAVHAAVAATRLTFDEDGRITGHHPNVVASPTKEHAARRFRQLAGVTNDQCLHLGDSVVDVHMMKEGGFNVLLMPPGEREKKLADFRTNHLEAMEEHLTAILVSDSLMPLMEYIAAARDLLP